LGFYDWSSCCHGNGQFKKSYILGDFLPKWAPILYKILVLAKYNFPKVSSLYICKKVYISREKNAKKCFREQVTLLLALEKG
jgi:hypothetical protein